MAENDDRCALNSETELISSLKKAYSSKGVPILNVASKVEFPKPLHSTLQSYKVEEAKKADFSWTVRSQKTVFHQEVLIPVCRYSDLFLATPLWLWLLHDSR